MSRESIRFGGGRLALIGVFAGVAIALGLPWLVLVYGQHLGATVLTIIIIASLLMGGLIALVAAFFGAVIPTVVESKPAEQALEAKPASGKTLSQNSEAKD
ncbi:MAG: hypothetical protein HY291_13150 [Planctomycetes bacterium]|nr:hypothetical protein [Planctomycetota bacterium]